MELEDLMTSLESDASAIQELVVDLEEYASEYCMNKIHAISILIDHQISLFEKWPLS